VKNTVSSTFILALVIWGSTFIYFDLQNRFLEEPLVYYAVVTVAKWSFLPELISTIFLYSLLLFHVLVPTFIAFTMYFSFTKRIYFKAKMIHVIVISIGSALLQYPFNFGLAEPPILGINGYVLKCLIFPFIALLSLSLIKHITSYSNGRETVG